MTPDENICDQTPSRSRFFFLSQRAGPKLTQQRSLPERLGRAIGRAAAMKRSARPNSVDAASCWDASCCLLGCCSSSSSGSSSSLAGVNNEAVNMAAAVDLAMLLTMDYHIPRAIWTSKTMFRCRPVARVLLVRKVWTRINKFANLLIFYDLSS